MSHAFNKSDGTFPHKSNGGVLGHPNKQAKSRALDRVGKSSPRQLETESIPFLKKTFKGHMDRKAAIESKYGTLEQRIKSFKR